MNYIDKVRGLFIEPIDFSLASLIHSSYPIRYNSKFKYLWNDMPHQYMISESDVYKPRFSDRDDVCNYYLITNISYFIKDGRFRRYGLENIRLRIDPEILLYDIVYSPKQTLDRLLSRYNLFGDNHTITTIKMNGVYLTKVAIKNGSVLDVSSSTTREHSRLIAVIKVLNALN